MNQVLVVTYRTIVKKSPYWGRPQEEYALVQSILPCCEDMASYLRSGAVSFGERPSPLLPQRTQSTECTARQLAIFALESSFVGHGPSGMGYDSFAIRFCPGCAARIDYREVERVILEGRIVPEQIDRVVFEQKAVIRSPEGTV